MGVDVRGHPNAKWVDKLEPCITFILKKKGSYGWLWISSVLPSREVTDLYKLKTNRSRGISERRRTLRVHSGGWGHKLIIFWIEYQNLFFRYLITKNYCSFLFLRKNRKRIPKIKRRKYLKNKQPKRSVNRKSHKELKHILNSLSYWLLDRLLWKNIIFVLIQSF